MKNPWVIIGILTIVLFGGAIIFSNNATEEANVVVEIKQNIKGNPDAAVTLTEYGDFQCGACANHAPAVTEVLNEYGESIRFEYKHFPLSTRHRNALSASVAAEAAGQQDKFFEYHDVLFASQPEWAGSNSPTSYYVKYAQDLGLDTVLFQSHLKSSALRDKVKAEFEEGREAGVASTPTFFLNGEAMQYDTFEQFFLTIAATVDPSILNATGTEEIVEPQGSEVRFGL